MQYLRPCWSDNRMLYGTCTISKALGASLYLIDCMWCYWKYVLGMYATLGVYCTYATVGLYCMYAKITGKKNRLSPSLDTMFNRTKVPSVCSSGLWKRLCRFLFFFSPLNTFCLVMLFLNECLNGWISPLWCYPTPSHCLDVNHS